MKVKGDRIKLGEFKSSYVKRRIDRSIIIIIRLDVSSHFFFLIYLILPCILFALIRRLVRNSYRYNFMHYGDSISPFQRVF